jgi:Leucine-rich repeat (LRR) protein
LALPQCPGKRHHDRQKTVASQNQKGARPYLGKVSVMIPIKQILLICAVVALVEGCASTPKVVPNSPEAKAAIEAAIRKAAKKPTGELTQADLEKVTKLDLASNGLTEVPKGLERLTQLKVLNLYDNKLTNVKGLENLTKLEYLALEDNQLTDVPKELEKLTQLKELYLSDNPDLTKAQIDQLKKALPKCEIYSNAKK